MVVDFGGEHEFVPEPLQVNAQNLRKRRAIRNSSSKSSNRFLLEVSKYQDSPECFIVIRPS